MIHKFLLLVVLIASLWIIPNSGYATHLMGGSMRYEYLGKSGSEYRYKITVEMYRDCSSTTPFDLSIEVGVYNNNISRKLQTQVYISLSSETSIDPPAGGSQCSFVPYICIKKGVYVQTISLPASTTGYHLYHVRCCRNNLVNLITNTGQTYYAFIPPTDFKDDSPYFTQIPTPYICAQDTINISYSAVDPDGDSLVYVLSHPWQGGTDVDPIPGSPAYLNLPIANAVYSSGFSNSKPFGTNGVASINSQTGLVTLMVPSSGYYAIAVDVKVYRDGKLVTTVRRDIELIVLNCPPNYIPRLNKPLITSFTVDEGNTLSFDIFYTDKDSMFMTHEGDIFGAPTSIAPPYATLANSSGKDTIKSKFTWNTSCEHGRQSPYFFTVKTRDNGCPNKTAISIFQIYVKPFVGPDSISGPVNVCEYTDSIDYKLYGSSKTSLLNWNITGGNLQKGIGTPDIKVGWGANGKGVVSLYETSQYGCGPVVLKKNVTIHKLPTPNAGNDTFLCSADTVRIGDPKADSTFKYHWSPSLYLSDSLNSAPLFSMKNTSGNPIKLKYYLSVINSNDCEGFDSIEITINPEPSMLSMKGTNVPCFNGQFPYEVQNNSGSKYFWGVDGGTQVTGGNTNKSDINWTDTSSGLITVYEINKYSCIGDTLKFPVTIIKPDVNIKGPKVVCPNTVNVEYWVKGKVGSKYNWFVYNGIRSDGNGTGSKIKINWPDSGTAIIKVIETTKEGCVSDTGIFNVLISYRLQTPPIEGDTFICEFTNGEPYQVMNVNGSTYDWWLTGGQIFAGNGLHKIDVNWWSAGYGQLKVLETSYDSVNKKACYGDTVYQTIVINPVPKTTPIVGIPDVCEYDVTSYHVSGFPGSTYFWAITDTNVVISGQGSDSISVSWKKQGIFKISVVELSKDSCPGSVIERNINVHPLPVTSEIHGDSAICYPNTNSIPYQVDGYAASVFNWQVIGGDISGNNGQEKILVDWNSNTTGLLTVQEVSEWGCIGPIINKTVSIDSLSPQLDLVTTLEENDKIISIQWQLLNAVHFNKQIYIYKNKPFHRAWELFDSVPFNQTSITDNFVETHHSVYEYAVAVENLCGDKWYTPTHNSILLNGDKITEFDVSLHWNDYINWPDGVVRYDLYRESNNSGNFKLVGDFSDTTALVDAALSGLDQCYRVAAIRQGNENIISWSNEICFKFEPVLRVPNAFTPNNDGLNDEFEVFAFNIAKYDIQIFNRWGELIYQSNDQTKHWDGTFHNTPSPVDVYVVIIQYEGNTGPKTYTGTITLVK